MFCKYITFCILFNVNIVNLLQNFTVGSFLLKIIHHMSFECYESKN